MRTCSLSENSSRIGSSSEFSEPETIRSTELPPPKTVSASPSPALLTLQPLHMVIMKETISSKAAKRLMMFINRPLFRFVVREDHCLRIHQPHFDNDP